MINFTTGNLAARLLLPATLVMTTLLFSTNLFAVPTLAVLDFELNDLTRVSDNSEEVKRTASLAPMLRRALVIDHEYPLATVPDEMYDNANKGVGYLFSHTTDAAQLGKKVGADWVVITRLNKPSFLFSYLIAQVVNVKTHLAYPELIVEIKGPQQVMSEQGIKKIAEKITQQIVAISRP